MSLNAVTVLRPGAAAKRPIERFARPFQEFAAREASAGILLLLCTLIALAWANSPWAHSYFSLWHTRTILGIHGFIFNRDFQFWINDGFMALFFLLAGLEIKLEFLVGEFASARKAALPIIAAIGGVLVPALLYSALNLGGPGAPGWGIPMATDIAFVMGVTALLGRRVPFTLKLFLTALAIVDDIAAVVVIAFFYTAQIAWGAVAVAAICFAALLATNRLRVRHPLPYAFFGLLLWAALLKSGVHATIAGVLLAVAIPCPTIDPLEHSVEQVQSALIRWEHALHPWITFAVMPLFALANAGVAFDASVFKGLLQPVSLGIVVGLLLGKPIGITLASWVAMRTGLGTLPDRISWLQLTAAGWLGGIGFTMSIFVAGLAFPDTALLNTAKLGIFTASLLAGVVGSILLLAKSPSTESQK